MKRYLIERFGNVRSKETAVILRRAGRKAAEGPTASPPPGTAARGHPGLPDLEADEGAAPHQGQGIESGKEFVLTWLENSQKR